MRNKVIDKVLEENAKLFQQLGTDSTKAEIAAARYKSVRTYALYGQRTRS